MVAVAAELLQVYITGAVPPVKVALAPPVAVPLQLTLLSTTVAAINTAGSVTITLEESVHPFASVTVTLYVPATTPVILAEVALLLHWYKYPEVPPVSLTVAPPSEKLLQLTLLSTTAAETSVAGSVITTLAESVQPLASVIVTLYVVADTPVILALVAALFHAYKYAPVPPVALAVAPPSKKVLHVTLLSTTVAAIKVTGSVITELAESVHPFASVMVTL
jgi:hypothetical protein